MHSNASIRRARRQAILRGFSLIELMIAMTVLTVGLLGGITLIGVATANNGRSKLHTTAVTLAESTMEKIVAIPKSATGAAAQTTMTDCAVPANVFNIQTTPGGPAVITDGAFAGTIDFSKPPQPGYSMVYVMCSANGGMTYDIRWRVDSSLNPPPNGPSLQMVTVSVKPLTGAAATQLTLPFTLHQLRGDF